MNTSDITRPSVLRRPAAVSTAVVSGALLALAAPLAASAHVTVDPVSAEPGGYTVLTVKVPNESATATTDRVELQLPTDTPFRSVSYVPVPGWTTELVSTTLPEPVTTDGGEITDAVTSVIWTAQPGAEISEGQLQQFALSVGPVPDTGSIMLPALQTYTDGEVVSWVDDAAADPDAEHPAPVLYIEDAPPADEHAGGHPGEASADPSAAAASPATPATSDARPDVPARVLGVVGLLLGAASLVLTLRRRATSR